jgi:trk system potassium uptake protein TrkA
MRVVFVGAGDYAVRTAGFLIEWGHEVVIIEREKSKVDELAEKLDCGFLQGDGSNPAILREAGPEITDILFCLSSSDQANIIAALVGRNLGFGRIITSLQNEEYEDVCLELGLEDLIIPSRTISRYLADIVKGVDILELSTLIKEDARLFSFHALREDAVPVGELSLPEGAKVICLYRDGNFVLTDSETNIKKGDEVVIMTYSEHINELVERWPPENAGEGEAAED